MRDVVTARVSEIIERHVDRPSSRWHFSNRQAGKQCWLVDAAPICSRLKHTDEPVMRFENLDVWKRSSRMSATLYQQLAELKDWGFRDQITRSGLSIPSNIAEGFERDSSKEIARFLQIAKGSCGELVTQIYIGIEAHYIDRETGVEWISETKEIAAMLAALIKRHRNNL